MDAARLHAPFPYPGGKRRIADVVWQALGNPRHYVEPFFGSGAVLLARPHAPAVETVNDADALLSNFWRAVQRDPDAVARHADFPVSEVDLFARHNELLRRRAEVLMQLEADPRWCDPELAGWWAWGASQWIGGGWCADRAIAKRQRPQLTHAAGVVSVRKHPALQTVGAGVHRASVTRQLPAVRADGDSGVVGQRVRRVGTIADWMRALAHRLRAVRVCNGDFARVLSPAVLRGTSGYTGVFLDPPYDTAKRAQGLYAHDASEPAERARAWCREHGAERWLRIVLAGLEGEHNELEALGWRKLAWKGHGGMARRGDNANRDRERLWLSPSCAVDGQRSLFGVSA
jgi:site-specific DNA-adenine methylase